MIINTFGKTKEQVTSIGMGGMRFDNSVSQKESISNIRLAHELGVNYFDTAPIYNNDTSEVIYGKALQGLDREEYLIATKGQNALSAKEMEKSIRRSLKRLGIEYIDFFFLWCIIYPEQYEKARMKGRAIETIIKAKEDGLIKHIGVSTHMYSKGIKMLADDDIFEFIMIPYNALNFSAREEGLRYAKDKNRGTVVMNPMYGGVIPEFSENLTIYPESKRNPAEDALRFCLESPYIDVTLAGMNKKEMIEQNISIANSSQKVSTTEQENRQASIKSGFDNLCTSCGYCLKHCPEEIQIKSYMEIYNTYLFSGDEEKTKERYNWYHKFGPLSQAKKKASDCTQCRACEEECTQYLNITERLEWLADKYEK